MTSVVQPTDYNRTTPIAKINSNTNNESIQPHPHPTANHNNNPPELRILTLNVWGLKYISHEPLARLTHIAHLITKPPSQSPDKPPPPSPTIVCLQELFTYTAYLHLRRLTRPILAYGHFYHSAAFGSGLVILSQYPIVETRMVAYSLNGRPSAFWRGDWYVGKGVACARIRLPRELWACSSNRGRERFLEVFNTHLHAPYDEGEPGKDTYSCHRVAQAWQIGGLMARALERGSLVLACGDFNMLPMGLEWRVIRARTRGVMRDGWRELHPRSSVGAWVDGVERVRLKAQGMEGRGPPTVDESLHFHGHTCDSVANTWRWSKSHQKDLLRKGRDREVGMGEEDPMAKRLDYIFFGQDRNEWVIKEARICMTERHPDLKYSLSDHFGVEAVIVRSPSPSSENHNPTNTPPEKETSFTPDPSLHTSILTLLHRYTHRQRLHRRRRLTHFLLSVIITIACWIAVFFSPANYVSFLLMLVASLGLMAGTVDGLIGGLFGGWELRGLKEWEGQVRRAERMERVEGGGDGEKGFRTSGMEGDMLEEGEGLGRVRDWFD